MLIQQTVARRAALAAWDRAVAAQRTNVAVADAYTQLDIAWTAAALPLPWYPGMVAWGISDSIESRAVAIPA